MRYHAEKSANVDQYHKRLEMARVQFTGEECGLCTRSITGRNRDDITIIDDEGREGSMRVCTYCFAVFNYLAGVDETNRPAQEGFSTLLGAVMSTRNANVRKGVMPNEYDEADEEQPARQYKLVPIAAPPSPAPTTPRQSRIPSWMPAEEVALLRGMPKIQPKSVEVSDE